jgi:hypothetical protein
MFRTFSGYKAQYNDLTLLVVSEFNEWKVMAYAPGVTLHGARQFTEPKAKEHAAALAQAYVTDVRHETLVGPPQLEWTPTSDEDWLAWRG